MLLVFCRLNLQLLHYKSMDDASSSTVQLFHEILQITDVLIGFEKHKVNLASMRGMRTVFEILHSALYELKTKKKIKDGGQEIPVCTEKTSVDIEEDDFIQKHIKVEKTYASSHASEKEKNSETAPVSLMDVLNMLYEAGSLALDAALELFLKFLCCVRLTLEMMLDEIIWREDLGSEQKTMPEHQGKQEPTNTLADEVPISAINHLLGLLSFGSLTKFDLERLILDSLKESVDYGVSGIERSFIKIIINKIYQDIYKILEAPPDKEFNKENEQTSPDKEFNEEKGQASADKAFKEEIVHTSPDIEIKKEMGQASTDKEFKEEIVHTSPDKEFNKEMGQASSGKEFKDEIVHTSPDKEFNKEMGQASPKKAFKEEIVHTSPDKKIN